MCNSKVHLLLVASLLYVVSFQSKSTCDAVQLGNQKLKILGVFPHPGKSHFDMFRPLLEELARRGHNLTVISHFPRSNSSKDAERLDNYRDISVIDSEKDVFVNVIDMQQIRHLPIVTRLASIVTLYAFAQVGCKKTLHNREVIELIHSNETFDLIFVENFNTDCCVAFAHKFKAPFIGLSSHELMPWTMDRIGYPESLSSIPSTFLENTRPLSFFGRVQNVLWTKFYQIAYDFLFGWSDQKFANEIFGSDLPPLRDIAKRQSATLVNIHYTLHGYRPSLPNVVEVGGLHIPAKVAALPRDIANFLDHATDGVLYFNLGSMIKASTMPKEKLDAVLKVLASIPRKVIWKWEIDELPWKPDNVLVKKWLPQFDILNHPNVKCYFGHGGLLGLSEAVYAGVPAILMPMYGDQFYNAAAAVTRGVAVVLKYEQLTEDTLRHALDELFNNTRYKENMVKLSKAYKDRPASPLETAVWWSEYIGRGNALEYLRSETAAQPWYQRCLLDVVLFVITVSLFLAYVIYRLTAFLLSLLCRARSDKTSVNGGMVDSKKKL